MNYIETALYPYRVHMAGSHLHRIWLPEVDFEKVTKLLFDMKSKGELLSTVDFSQELKIVDIALDLSDLQTVSNCYGTNAMYIQDHNGKYEAVAYDKKKHDALPKDESKPSAAQYTKKRTKK